MSTSIQCASYDHDPDGNCLCYLCYWIRDSAVELQQEILRHLLLAVSPQTSRQLRFSPRVRKLWDAPHALELLGDSAEAWRFCIDVQEFQIGILATHSRIHFANISVLQMTLYEEVELVIEFRAVLGLLQIQDLRLFCGNSPTFLGGALRTWAPSLQGLTILRILFDRSSEQKPHSYPWLRKSWPNTLALLSKLRTLWLDTPLALSDSMERTLSRDSADRMNLHEVLQTMIKKSWASQNPAIKRVYLFFGYDEDLNMGDSLTCVGYRFRAMRVASETSSGDSDWKAVDISAWSETPSRNYFNSYYHPYDGLPGILEDDRDSLAI